MRHLPTYTLIYISNCLQETGEDNVSLLLVTVTELLTVGALLALGPGNHLCGTNGDKDSDGPVTADNDDSNPCKNLVQVVGAGDDTETVASGDLALSTTSGSESREISVDESVHELAEAVQGNSDSVDGGHIGLGGERARVVDGVGAGETRDGPVEEAVFEDVLPGHGVGGELVDEESLVLALDEVQHDHGETDPLSLGHVGVSIGVQIGAGCDEEGMENEGTEVLDDEDGSPSNLVSCYMG